MNRQMRSVLILDDNEAVRKSLEAYFEDCTWRVLCAESAEDALDLLRHDMADCAVVDIRLPGMVGNAFIRQAATMCPDMVFVICTGSPRYQLPADVAELPVVSSEIFNKPVGQLNELKQHLLDMIEQNNII